MNKNEAERIIPNSIEISEDDYKQIICRCEEVTLGDIKAAIAEGYLTVDAIKRATRAGMGSCQGRSCGRLIRQILSMIKSEGQETLVPATARPPLRPCKLAILAKADEPSQDDPAELSGQDNK
jgi:NAD(P)H-nitrite reductase large subunit